MNTLSQKMKEKFAICAIMRQVVSKCDLDNLLKDHIGELKPLMHFCSFQDLCCKLHKIGNRTRGTELQCPLKVKQDLS